MPLIFLTPILVNLSYGGIFIWFLVFDQFMPVLEELALLSIGYFSALGVFNPYIAIPVALLALGIVDNIFYFLTISGSKHLKFIEKAMRHNLVIKYQMKMKKKFTRTFMVLTFTPKIRFFAPVLAGALKMRRRKFLVIDLLSLIFFVSIYVLLGYFFYSRLTAAFAYLQNSRHLIFIGAVVAILIFSVFITKWANKKMSKL